MRSRIRSVLVSKELKLGMSVLAVLAVCVGSVGALYAPSSLFGVPLGVGYLLMAH